ncbi:hypothetical protein I3760_04G095600 [Carya illinoinensis]|nr:hypothetical protein I3760_04G095600 [Carya illinoinensis]
MQCNFHHFEYSNKRSELGDANSKNKKQNIRFQAKEGKSSKKKSPGKNIVTNVPNVLSELLGDLKNRINTMGGTGVIMLTMQKALTKTDVKRGQTQLFIPFGQINMDDFLRELGEKKYLHQQNEIEVPFIEPSNMFSKIILRQWDMRKTSGRTNSMYALEETLVDEDVVLQIWLFFKLATKNNSAWLLLRLIERISMGAQKMVY